MTLLLALWGCAGDPGPAEPVATEAPAVIDPGPFAPVWPALEPMADESSFQVALEAFRVDLSKACPLLIARADATRDSFDRSLRAVGALRCPGAVGVAKDLWMNSKLDASRWEAAFVLGVLPEPEALGLLHDGALKGDEVTRRSALVALGRRQDPSLCPVLLEAAAAESKGVRLSAITAAWDSLCLDGPALAGLSHDPDPEIVEVVGRLQQALAAGPDAAEPVAPVAIEPDPVPAPAPTP